MLWFKYPFFLLFSSESYMGYANAKYAKLKNVFYLIFSILLCASNLIIFNVLKFTIEKSNSWNLYIIDSVLGFVFVLAIMFSVLILKLENLWLKKSYFLISFAFFLVLIIWEFTFIWYRAQNTSNHIFLNAEFYLSLTSLVVIAFYIDIVLVQWIFLKNTEKVQWQMKKINLDNIKHLILKKDFIYWNKNEKISEKIDYFGTIDLKLNGMHLIKNIFKYENEYFELIPMNFKKYNLFALKKNEINKIIEKEIMNMENK